jgi:lipoic acid synthetase
VKVGRPESYDLEEPKRVANAVKKMDIKHAVLTMVARDDLEDNGAFVVAETIRLIQKIQPECSIEALISDLKGSKKDLYTILDAKPDILNHNLETVKRLQKALRVQAKYDRSMQILKWAKQAGFLIKSGIMVGVGETIDEVVELMADLRKIDCEVLTIGQYLPPTKEHFPLSRFYHPDEFSDLQEIAYNMGFTHVESGPLVRSSYHAEKAVSVNS